MLWLEHISPEQLQMGIAVCSLLTVLLLIVTLHKINRKMCIRDRGSTFAICARSNYNNHII